MPPKCSILTFTAHYLPAFKAGGPVQSVANLIEHLEDEFDFRIVTEDRDAGDACPFPEVTVGKWTRVGHGHVLYLNKARLTLGKVRRIIQDTPHDAVYLNSFFNPRFTLLPLLVTRLRWGGRLRVIVAPRGEFSLGALSLKSVKKRLYIALSKLLGLYNGVLWKASTSWEAADIRAVFGAKARIHIASDLPRAIRCDLSHSPRALGEPLRILFLSRISPIKNLNFTLDVLARVRVPVDLSIVGPIDDPSYWADCQQIIAKLPPHVRVSYQGVVPAPEVPGVMARHDLFILPTLGENFGHVIIEALGSGTPVLISDRTPWQNFTEAGCGWIEPLDAPHAYAAHIDDLYGQTPEQINVRRIAALQYAKKFMTQNQLIEDNRALFRPAPSGGGR